MRKPTSCLLLGLLAGGLIAAAALAQEKGSAEQWTAPARAAKKKNPVAADPASIARGKVVYTKECESCHGPAGKGDGPAARELEKKPGDLSSPKMWDQTDGALFWKLTEGRKPMPSYDKTLTPDQRWDVINYVRTLAPKKAG